MLDKDIIKKDLIKLADKKYKEFHSNLCPGTKNILGIRVPILREYAKNLNKEYELQELLDNIDNEYYEEIMLQGMIIGLNTKADFKVILECIKKFIPKIENWAICDVFCAGLKIVNKNKDEMWQFIQIYLKSKNEFEIRFAVVIILDYYIQEEYLYKIFEIFNNINSDYYYVKMAVAWAISVCIIKFYNDTLEYLLHDATIDNWTYNKAIQKALESYRVTDKKKTELRKLKKR